MAEETKNTLTSSLEKLLEFIRENDYYINDSGEKVFAKDMTDEELTEFRAKELDGTEDPSYSAHRAQMDNLNEVARTLSSPEVPAEDVEDIIGDMSIMLSDTLKPEGEMDDNARKFAEEATEIIGAISGIFNASEDKKIARDQINNARTELASLSKPEGIRPLKRSVNLQNALRIAQSDLSPVNQELATQGLKSDIEDQYRRDLNVAKTASGGQSGAYGSRAQAASLNRIRNAMYLQEAKRRMRNEALSNYGRLTAQEIAENEAAARNDASRAFLDDRVYAREAEAAGRALAAGQQNLRTGRHEFWNSLSNFAPIAGRYIEDYRQGAGARQAERAAKSKLRTFDTESDIVDYSNELDNSLYNPDAGYSNPYNDNYMQHLID